MLSNVAYESDCTDLALLHQVASGSMYSCQAQKPCCLKSSSLQVCSQRNDVHCIDCELFSHLTPLGPDESVTVCGDEQAAKRLRCAHTKTSLIPWAKHHKIKNYCRLTHDQLCVNLAKKISGDSSVMMQRKAPRKRRKRNQKTNKNDEENNPQVKKNGMPEGYRTCICGTDLCKQTMVNYFNNYHDYDWPDKLFPWLYVGIPKRPREHVRSTTRGSRVLKRERIRSEKINRRGLFCKHLQLHDSEDFASHNGVVAFPVHFPLIW